MKTPTIPLAALLVLLSAGGLTAAPLVISSPDRGETETCGAIVNQELHWNPRLRHLTAVITFSNRIYNDDLITPHDDTLRFSLPGVRYDEAANTFYSTAQNGGRVPFARFRATLFFKTVELLPGAKIYVENSQGKVSIKLVKAGPDDPRQWTPVP